MVQQVKTLAAMPDKLGSVDFQNLRGGENQLLQALL